MSKIKVTQVRSIIGRDETQKRTIQALGLGKINRSRVHNDTPAIRGMINKVRHLVSVEDIVPETAPESVQKPVKADAPAVIREEKKVKSAKEVKEETPKQAKAATAEKEEAKVEKTNKEATPKKTQSKKKTEKETTESDSATEE